MKFLTLLMLTCAFNSSAFAVTGAHLTKQKSETPGPIVVEPDQTDIYAIPLDEDADEQQEELYNLEYPKK